MVSFKRVMACALVVCIIASMSVVAFATSIGKGNTAIVDEADKYVTYDPHLYTDAKNAATLTGNVDGQTIPYGKTVYIPFVDADGATVKDSAAVSALKVSAKWTLNGKYIESIEIIKKEGAYMMAIKTVGAETKDKDIEGTISITGKAYAATDTDAKKVKVNKTEIDVTLTLQFDEINSGDDYEVTKDGKLFKFDDNRDTDMADEEFEFTFEEFDDVTFTVDTTHQNDIVMKADDKADENIEKANPTANMDFYNFYGATFRKAGDLFIPASKNSFIYEIVNGAVVPVKAVYDDFDEGLYVRTKTLGFYVVSDVELVNATSVVAAEPTVSAVVTNEPVANPSTGAAL